MKFEDIDKILKGVNGQKAAPGSIIYNSKGECSSGTAPGVYIEK